jgi:hypothetical protein
MHAPLLPVLTISAEPASRITAKPVITNADARSHSRVARSSATAPHRLWPSTTAHVK